MNRSSTNQKARKRQFAILVMVILTCCIAVAFAVQAYNKEASVAAPEPVKPVAFARTVTPRPAVQSSSNKELIETEIITILPDGFDPPEISRPHGRFFLMVDNRSGLEEVSLRLDKQSGNRLREVRVHREALDWTDAVDLSPGTYFLTEVNNPGWVCKITITGN